jgi:plasmid maintenance system antidote protein VapI
MAKKSASQPMNPFHPGEILLEEFLRPGRITRRQRFRVGGLN